MRVYNIRGISVDFPYEAYDCQITYMDKVIQALQEKKNALLESPTGTGKTLCLLCATLAYRRSLGSFNTGKAANDVSDVGPSQSNGSLLPKIVYTSRTHSQLRQVVKELKSTSYRPKMMVLGSREQLCIHDKVKLLHGKAQSNACQYVRKRNSRHQCRHFKLTTDFVKSNPHIGDEPIDIEDLVNIGTSCGPCPYYVSRELLKVVDILFAPYNYLIDRHYKESLGIDWSGSILIFDEAHNLESICADAASFDLPTTLLSSCIAEAKSCIDLSVRRRDVDKSNDKSCNPDNFAILRALLLKLEQRIAEVPIESKELGFTRPGPYIYELLGELNVTTDSASHLTGIIEEAVLLLEEDANGNQRKESHGSSCRLEIIGDILRQVFKDGGTSHAKFYRVHVHERVTTDDFKGSVSKTRTLSWWCFNPGIGMEDFSRRGVGSVILTSGTLSPMDSFAYELKMDFPIRLENPHVISSDQIWAGVVPGGPSDFSLNSSFRNRDLPEYKKELGNAIVNFARIVPDGLLVFFPSYYVMEQCISCWKDNVASHSSIWERICKFKRPVVEPRQSSLFTAAIEDFKSKLIDRSASGAVFFAVCRGKVSEGLDFADQCGRAVIITGLPFPPRMEPKVRLKREYLDEETRNQNNGHKPLTGEQWYDQQASRAVNQAVGRVIRHRHDYGAIIFCDERFASLHRQSQVSSWIQPHIKCHSKFGESVYSLTRFFRVGVNHLVKAEPSVKVEPCVKVEPPDTIYNERSCEGKMFRSVDSFCLENKLNTVPVNDDCCIISSPGTSVVNGKNSCKLKEIIPANRASLTSRTHVDSPLRKEAGHLFGKESKLFHSTFRSMYGEKASEIIDLTNSTVLRNPDGVIVPCSSKRQKVIKKEPDEKSEDVRISGNANQNRPSTSGQEKEVKGSDFLFQVREKLSESEYGEFVGYMKALKSKAMKIGYVLQSVSKLFSGQERVPLLLRFKNFLPEKYHSLYEQYCASTGGTDDT